MTELDRRDAEVLAGILVEKRKGLLRETREIERRIVELSKQYGLTVGLE